MINDSRPYTFDRVIRLLIGAGCLLAVFWLLNRLSDALLPFFVACLLAYIFEPFVAFNKRILRLRGNFIPILLFLIELCGIVALFFYLVVPTIADELVSVSRLIKGYISSPDNPYIPEAIDSFIRRNIDFSYISSLLTQEQWTELVKSTISGTWTVVSGSISLLLTILSWFIVLLYFIFILLDYDNFMASMRELVPAKYKHIVFSIVGDVKYSMNKYFRGQALIALCVGILFSVGFLIIDMPMAIVLGLSIGVLATNFYHPHDVPLHGLCRRNRHRILAHLHTCNGCLRRSAADTRPLLDAQNHGEIDGTQPGNHPTFVVGLGVAVGLSRAYYCPTANNAPTVLLSSLRAPHSQAGNTCRCLSERAGKLKTHFFRIVYCFFA